MHSKVFLAGVVATGCSLATASVENSAGGIFGLEKDAGALRRRDGPSVSTIPKWASTVAPEKLSALHSDMQVLASSIKSHTLYSSMTAVLATAVPQSFKDAVKTAPSSVHSQYKSTKPEWYMAMPTDIRSFMDANRHAAKSIFTKDVGPLPTSTKGGASVHANAPSASGGIGSQSQSVGGNKGGKPSSDAHSFGVAGTAISVLLCTFGIAAFLL